MLSPNSLEERQRRFEPEVGDVVAIEFRRMFKKITILRNFGPQEPEVVVEPDGLAEIAECRAEAVQKLFWLHPVPNIIVLDIISSTGPTNEPIAPRPGKFLWLSQNPETSELDILDLYEPEETYGGSDFDYLEEIRDYMKDGLAYQYVIARVLAVVSRDEEERY